MKLDNHLIRMNPVSTKVLSMLREYARTATYVPKHERPLLGSFTSLVMDRFRVVDDVFPVDVIDEFRVYGIPYRIEVMKMPPGTQTTVHIDSLLAHKLCSKFHVVLSEAPSKTIIAGNTYTMYSGVIYNYNNRVLHQAVNESNVDRVHLTVDILGFDSLEVPA